MVLTQHLYLKVMEETASENREGKQNAHSKNRGDGEESPVALRLCILDVIPKELSNIQCM